MDELYFNNGEDYIIDDEVDELEDAEEELI